MKKKSNQILKNLINKSYSYGYKTNLNSKFFPQGINENIISLISEKKKEPFFLKNFRKNAYYYWLHTNFPIWSKLNIKNININNIKYYSIPIIKSNNNIKITQIFNLLGLVVPNQAINQSKTAIDFILDSTSIKTTYNKNLAKFGIIFCSISEAIELYPFLIKKFLGTIIPSGDNFFSALNSAIFTDGSFCYIPQNVYCPINLSSYFRINNINSGQFERTLIISEKNSYLNYLEGCTASKNIKNQLHAAIVELISFNNSEINYFTIQNWYEGNKNGFGGIFNFVTKRGLCIENNSRISWTQVETGSAITWKYPSCILIGNNSFGNFYSIALTKFYQQADTGTKFVHLGEKTKSKILSKGISSHYSKNIYRGLIKIGITGLYSKNYSQCDSFLINNLSQASTYPYIDVWNSCSNIEHEAIISKISDEQLFYLSQRGINFENAINLLINGFCKDILNILPTEFANEAYKLLSLKLENTIG